MSKPLSPPIRLSLWIQACGVLFILTGLFLAEGAAAWQFIATALPSPGGGTILWSAIAYWIFAGAGLIGLRWIYRHFGARSFLLAILGISFLIQMGAILAADQQWSWTGDAHVFHHYLTRLSESGYTQETLGELSQNYDYPIWTRRAQPFYYALHSWAGTHFIHAIQIFQALLLTLSLALTWRISRLLFSRNIAFWAVSLQLLMPFRWMACLNLNHHLIGGFYFLTGLWMLAEWLRPQRRRLMSWGIFIGMGILFPLMRLEGGIDIIFGGAVLLVLTLCWATRQQNGRKSLQSATVLMAWPLLLSILILTPLFKHIDQADLHRPSSGTVAFMARGWMPETGGEYSYTYERIDGLTPAEDKISAQASILASQAFYNPCVLLLRLFPIKLAKYFLLGYASGTEEMFEYNGAHLPKLMAEGARTAYLLAILPLIFCGGILLLPLLRDTKRLCLILPSTLFCIAIVLLGETSPRYSIYLQPLLFMLGALPLAWGAHRCRRLLRAGILPGLLAASSLGSVFLIAAGLLFGMRPWLQSHSFQDMRSWKVDSSLPPLALPPTLAPFEIHLSPQQQESGTTWGTVQIPVPSKQARILTFYAIPSGVPSGLLQHAQLITEYITDKGIRKQTHSLPGLIRVECPSATSGVLRLSSPITSPFPLHIGYASYDIQTIHTP